MDVRVAWSPRPIIAHHKTRASFKGKVYHKEAFATTRRETIKQRVESEEAAVHTSFRRSRLSDETHINEVYRRDEDSYRLSR
jgi:hypothetical protein